MAVIIVLTNQKGGVGKTTSSAALAGGLVQKGFRVLAIDMDPQGNLGFSLGLGQEEGDIYEVLSGAKGIRVRRHSFWNDAQLHADEYRCSAYADGFEGEAQGSGERLRLYCH